MPTRPSLHLFQGTAARVTAVNSAWQIRHAKSSVRGQRLFGLTRRRTLSDSAAHAVAVARDEHRSPDQNFGARSRGLAVCSARSRSHRRQRTGASPAHCGADVGGSHCRRAATKRLQRCVARCPVQFRRAELALALIGSLPGSACGISLQSACSRAARSRPCCVRAGLECPIPAHACSESHAGDPSQHHGRMSRR